MARKDDILQTFLEHEILKQKYKISKGERPGTVREGLTSSIPIIKTLSLIVDKLESSESVRDNDLRNLITQYLNQAAI